MQKNFNWFYFPILLLLISTFSLEAFAQATTVTGTIRDAENKQPLAGATAKVLGQTVSAASNEIGQFTLQVPSNNVTLEISYIGYQTKQVVANGDNLDILLSPTSKDLGEIVVVAYGTSKRGNITGSVSTINNKQIENRQVSSLSKALEGQVPGLQSVASSGQPGTDASIRIRGIGSINASSSPLYVVDGNPFAGDINSLNPNDIQSISILKDAASSALYGSRGANGVIIITTKAGKSSDEASINANFTQGLSQRAVKDYNQVSTDQYFELYWEALRNRNLSNGMTGEAAAKNASATLLSELNINPYGSVYPEPVGLDGKLLPGAKPLWNDDWRDVLQRTGKRTQADLNISGGGDKSSYFISGGYLNDQGMAIESGFKRYNVRANLDTKAKSWLNAGLNVAGSSTSQNYPQSEDSNTANIINFSRLVPSFFPYYERNTDGSYKLDENGNKVYDFGLYRPSAASPNNNLAASLPLDKNDIQKENISARTYLEAVLTPNVKFKSTYSIDYINANFLYYTNPVLGQSAETRGSVDKTNAKTIGQTWNNILTFEKDFGEHHLNILGGHEYYDYYNGDISGSRSGFVLPNFYEPIAASQLGNFSGSSVSYKLLSFLGRAEYNYQNKYFLSSSLRTDGSSRFASDTRWGTFWSVGGSWKVAEESFIKDNTNLNQLTLRASYGGQGNDNLGVYYAYQGLYSIANSLGEGGTVTSRLPTPDLKWETNLNLNVGLDIAAFQNRLSVSVEYFNRQSKNLLFTMPMPPSLGYSGYDANIGSLKNNGVDLEIRTTPIRNENFRWNFDLNLSYVKNKITELPEGQEIISGNQVLRVGGSRYDFYIPEWAGVNPENGNPLWYLADEEGNKLDQTTSVYSDAGRFVVGSALPDFIGGASTSLTYKQFDLAANLSFAIGGQVLDNDYTQLMHNGNNVGRSWSTEILNRWTPENTQTNVPRVTTENLTWTQASTRFLYSGTYARLKNVSIGYTLSPSSSSKLHLGRLRAFITGENLLTFYGHKGMDPEQTVGGTTYFRYPAMRTFSAGIQLSL